MTKRNIHGDFTITFENRLLDTATWGATNSELGFALRKIFPKQSIVGVFPSYAEAHQACRDKFAESQRK
ncbi:DUF4170 domain-containing protein [Vibrio profundum]|uniref:hypothetical protein n=1 Tax=Vibrio profundum TaxID=2910247 RepID=UPI003D0B2D18